MIKTISATKLAKRLKKEPIRIIDIRSEGEFNGEHIKGAENIPATKISNDLKYTKDDILVFSCLSGMRTRNASSLFEKLDAKEILILDGGLNAWKSTRLETVKDEQAILVRKIQTAIFMIIVIGFFMAFSMNKYFLLLSIFGGAGLFILNNLIKRNIKIPFLQTK